jgi:hypothetical protein
MADGRDTLRIVTLSDGGRPVAVLDLNDADGYFRDREGGFAFTPAAVTQQVSRRAQRFGGGRVVGEIHDNGSIGWTAYVRGSTVVECSQRVEALLSQVHETARGRFIEWAPDGLASSFLELAGPGAYTASYDPQMLAQSQAMRVQISFPVLPLVQWAPMTIGDGFAIDSIADYTFGTGSGTLAVSGGRLVPSSTSEKELYHSARSYQYEDVQVTLKLVRGTVDANTDVGVTFKRLDASNYLLVSISQNGTGLRIRKKDGGSFTTLASDSTVTLVATTLWVRARIVGNVITAEFWDTEPFVYNTSGPTDTATYTLTGADATKFGAGVSGYAGIRTGTSHASDWAYDDFAVKPYAYRAQSTPSVLQLPALPGEAPALVTIKTALSGASRGGTAQFAMFAWDRRPATAQPPMAVLQSAAATPFPGGWTETSGELQATTSGAATYSAFWTLTLSDTDPDDFTDNYVAFEVWARIVLSSTLVAPTFRAELRPLEASGGIGTAIQTSEFGSTGRLVVKPSSGTVRRFTRLGILGFSTYASQPPDPRLYVVATVAGGSTGLIGLDYVIAVPARRRSLSPTGIAGDSTYPTFVAGTAVTKTIRPDLSGLLGLLNYGPQDDRGLGGALPLVAPGPRNLLVKLSDLAPDDPRSDATTETATTTADIQLDVTPRSFMLRGS